MIEARLLKAGKKALAALETEDDYLDLCSKRSGYEACIEASRKLRLLADVFEELALNPNQYKADTQDKLNEAIS